jgi:hypothetical protein
MEYRISAAELGRTLEDILGRVRYQRDSFVVERNGDPMARIVPPCEEPGSSVRDAISAWFAAGAPDRAFADELERIGARDRPPENPWAS